MNACLYPLKLVLAFIMFMLAVLLGGCGASIEARYRHPAAGTADISVTLPEKGAAK